MLVWKASGPAGIDNKMYRWALWGILGVYVPGKCSSLSTSRHGNMNVHAKRLLGSYILYTHMMTQRRKVIRGKARVDRA